MRQGIGVVLIDFDQGSITRRCLRSLAEGTRRPDLVVLVQNGTEPCTLDPNQEIQAVVLGAGTNLGCAGGRNLGLNFLAWNTELPTLVLLDNDTVVPLDFLEQIAKLDFQPLEVFAPVIHDFETDAIWSSGGRIGCPGPIDQMTSPVPPSSPPLEVDWAPGACLVMSKQTWQTVGEFDTWLNFLFEDIEWCQRVRAAGGRILVQGNLRLRHEAHQSLGGRWSPQRVRYWARNGTFFQMAVLELGVGRIGRWLGTEAVLVFRDLALGRWPWSAARARGLGEGVAEAVRRHRRRSDPSGARTRVTSTLRKPAPPVS